MSYSEHLDPVNTELGRLRATALEPKTTAFWLRAHANILADALTGAHPIPDPNGLAVQLAARALYSAETTPKPEAP